MGKFGQTSFDGLIPYGGGVPARKCPICGARTAWRLSDKGFHQRYCTGCDKPPGFCLCVFRSGPARM